MHIVYQEDSNTLEITRGIMTEVIMGCSRDYIQETYSISAYGLTEKEIEKAIEMRLSKR